MIKQRVLNAAMALAAVYSVILIVLVIKDRLADMQSKQTKPLLGTLYPKNRF